MLSRSLSWAGEDAALLPRLGAGTALLPAERHAGLEKYFEMVDPSSRYFWGLRIVFVGVLGPFIVTGWGVQSPWQNRCSAAAFLLAVLLAAPAMTIWPATLHVATELIASKIDAITAALQREHMAKGTDTMAEQWEEAVVEPVRGLIRDLETLGPSGRQ